MPAAEGPAAHLLQPPGRHQGAGQRHAGAGQPRGRGAQEGGGGAPTRVGAFPRGLCEPSVLLPQVYSSLSEGELQLLRQTLLIFFQDMNVRVSYAPAVSPPRFSPCRQTLFLSGVAFPQKSSAEPQRTLRHAAIRPGASRDGCPRTHQVRRKCDGLVVLR